MLTQWLAKHPHDQEVRLYLANQQYLGTRYAEAIANYRAVIAADPRNATALNNLASTYLRIHDPQALTIAQAAFELSPDDANILDTLGTALLEQGNTERALETLKKAIARNPESAEIRLHLASALAKAGDKAGARMELRRIAESGQAGMFDAEAKALLAGP